MIYKDAVSWPNGEKTKQPSEGRKKTEEKKESHGTRAEEKWQRARLFSENGGLPAGEKEGGQRERGRANGEKRRRDVGWEKYGCGSQCYRGRANLQFILRPTLGNASDGKRRKLQVAYEKTSDQRARVNLTVEIESQNNVRGKKREKGKDKK